MKQSEKPEISPDKLEEWIESVEEGDYSFLEERPDLFTHGAPERKRDEGLGNFAAYLAVYREDGELNVDDEMVEMLDELQRENGAGKQRYRNITNRLEQNFEEKNTGGHQELQKMIKAYRKHTKDSLPSNNETVFKDYTQNQSSNSSEGGDNSNMTDDLYDNQLNTLAGKLDEMDGYSTEVVQAAARLERQSDSVLEAAGELIDEYRETGINVQRAVQSWIDEQKGKLQGVDSALEGTSDSLDTFENKYLDGDYGISDSAKDAFSDAAGYDITQDL